MNKPEKQPIVVFCIADEANYPYARTMIKSLRKFHPDWPVKLYTNTTKHDTSLDVELVDLNPLIQGDPMFFYRATPILAEKLLDEYECVIKIDADSLVLGDLSYIAETKDFDCATVINWNRHDMQFFPPVEMLRLGIAPPDYFNCGFVVLRSKAFAHNWTVNCFTDQFNRMQYKEQDVLNIMCYFGNWNVRCLDHPDIVGKHLNQGWWGLISKGELSRAILKDNKIIIPKGFGDTPFPPVDEEVKVVHMAGGQGMKKDNWHAFFPVDVMEYVTTLIT